MKASDIKDKFSPALFWDIDKEDLDMEMHKTYIITRVLDYGMWEDWKLIRDYYSISEIRDTALKARSLFPKTVSFVAAVTHTAVKEFRCYREEQSSTQHWNF